MTTINWGDANNSVNSTFAIDSIEPLSVGETITSADGAVLTITGLDDATGQVSFSVQHKYLFVTVSNAAPSVALNAVAGTANSPATLTGSFTDFGLLDEHTLTVKWDDPNNANDSVFAGMGDVQTLSVGDTFTSTGADTTTTLKITSVNTTTGVVGFEVKHTYTAASTRTIQVTIQDDDLGQNSATATAVISPEII